MGKVIVTRHTGLIEWLKGHGIEGDVIAQATPADVTGRDVVGILPLHLAALTTTVTVVDMPGLTAEQRGKDLSPAEMDAAGASMRRYKVIDMGDASDPMLTPEEVREAVKVHGDLNGAEKWWSSCGHQSRLIDGKKPRKMSEIIEAINLDKKAGEYQASLNAAKFAGWYAKRAAEADAHERAQQRDRD